MVGLVVGFGQVLSGEFSREFINATLEGTQEFKNSHQFLFEHIGTAVLVRRTATAPVKGRLSVAGAVTLDSVTDVSFVFFAEVIGIMHGCGGKAVVIRRGHVSSVVYGRLAVHLESADVGDVHVDELREGREGSRLLLSLVLFPFLTTGETLGGF